MNRVDVLIAFGALLVAAIELPAQLVPGAQAREPKAEAATLVASKAAPAPPPDATCPAADTTLPEPAKMGDDPPIPEIEDPAGEMAPFYEHLAAVARKTAKDHVRIAFYGDSNATHDFMSGAIRRKLQAKYGDAGHGYVAIARPWGWYRHMDVRHTDDGTWETFNVTTHTMWDERYGHAFIAAQSSGGSKAWVETAEDGAPIGTSVSRIEVSYIRGPWFGTFEASVDGKVVADVDTHAAEFGAGFFPIDAADGPHKLQVMSKGNRAVRILGATFERGSPSVVVDGLGVGSLNCICLLRGDAQIHDESLQHRKYDLVIVHIGTNLFDAAKVAPCLEKAIARYRAALPGVPIMLMTAPDFIGSHEPPKTAGWMNDTLREMRRAAREAHAPLFDFHVAMGGDGSMARFYKAGMLLPGDWVHFNAKGAAYMGDRIVDAMFRGLRGYIAKEPRAGCAR